MKGGFYGLRGKQISLTLIAFICATIFLWAWDKTALLATVNPPQSLYINPSTESVRRVPFSKLEQFDSNVRDKDDFVDVVGGGEKKGELENENIVDFGAENNLDRTDDFQTKTPQIEKKGSRFSSLEEQKKTKQDLYGETSVEPLEKTPLSGISADSKTKNVLKTGSDENSTMVIEEKKATACNYAKGKWVEDTARPLYSGFECKQWLSEMWACRLTQRTDFAYETFRWLPNDCSMPEFEPSSFLKRMQDKTIAIVGDSLGRQQFQSMMCMVTAGKQRSDVLDIGYEYGLTLSPGATRPSGWAYRFPTTNTTILYYWSASLTDLTPINITNPTTDWAMHLDRPPGFLRDYLHKFDVLVLNTGHHWNRGKLQANRWVMYVGGVPNRDRKIAQIGGAKDFTIYSIVKWLDSELPKHPKLKAFFRTISPRHFFHGDWNSGGSCDNTTPLAGGKEVVKNESSDPVVAKAVEGTRVKLLDITAISELRDEGHISRYSIKATPGVQDCLHWCLPGVPDTWNEILFAQL